MDIACGHGAHDVEGAGGPECAVDVGGVAHGVEQRGGWGITHDAYFKEAYAVGGVGAFCKCEGDQGEAHAYKDVFTVVYLARCADDHQFPGSVMHRIYPFYHLI